ncbi:MAG: hypothetical protein OCD76_05995 [Reichenbachiella sp.]
MKKAILIAVVFLCYVKTVQAQNHDRDALQSDPIIDKQFGDLQQKRKMKGSIEGTYYLWDVDRVGIVVKNGVDTLERSLINYDIFNDKVEVTYENREYSLIGEEVSVIFTDGITSLEDDKYVRLNTIDIVGGLYCELFSKDDVRFYSLTEVSFYPSNYSPITDSGYEHDRYVKTELFFLIKESKLLVKSKSLKKMYKVIKKDLDSSNSSQKPMNSSLNRFDIVQYLEEII